MTIATTIAYYVLENMDYRCAEERRYYRVVASTDGQMYELWQEDNGIYRMPSERYRRLHGETRLRLRGDAPKEGVFRVPETERKWVNPPGYEGARASYDEGGRWGDVPTGRMVRRQWVEYTHATLPTRCTRRAGWRTPARWEPIVRER